MDKKINDIISEIDKLIDFNKTIILYEQGTTNSNQEYTWDTGGKKNTTTISSTKPTYTVTGAEAPGKSVEKTKQKDEKIKYFDFGGLGKIPYVVGTKFYRLTDTDTGRILGLTKKDKYGYYDEIDVENYGEPIRRYYPTNDWEDWKFIQKKGIPYSFKTPDGKYFHLILKLIDPTKSVIDLEDPNNKSRGWALSYPNSKIALNNDSGSGYYRTEGGTQIPYNVTAPIVPGDYSTFDLDIRSGFDKFMDSGVGILAQIGLAIGVTLLTRNLAVGRLVAQEIVSVNAIRARLFAASILSESIVNAPVAIYYFNREGYENAGWLSLAFIALPVVQRFTPLVNILPDFSLAACYGISAKIMASKLETNMTQAQIKAFMNTLTMEEKALFAQVVKNVNNLSPKIMKAVDNIAKKSYKGTDYLAYKAEIVALLKKDKEESLLKTLVMDFGITLTYIKVVENMLGVYESIKKKQNIDLSKLPKEQKEKIAKNIKKVDEEINMLPEWTKYSFSNSVMERDPTKLTQLELSPDEYVSMIELGVFSEETRKKLLKQSADALIEIGKLSEEQRKEIETELGFDLFELAVDFLEDPSVCEKIGPEKCAEIKKLFQKYTTIVGGKIVSTQTPVDTKYEQYIYQFYIKNKNEWKTVSKEEYELWKQNGYQTRVLSKDGQQEIKIP